MSPEQPENAPPIEALRTLLLAGRAAEAATQIETHLDAHPDDVTLNKLMGVARLHLGEAAGAVVFFRKCAELEPGNAEAQFNTGVALEAAEEWSSAATALRSALEIDGHFAGAHNNLGLILNRLGQTGGAISHLETAVALKANSAIFHTNLATIQKQAGLTDKAIEHFEQAIALDPAFEQAYGNYGDLLQFLNRLDEVEALLQRASTHCDLTDPGLLDLQAHLAIHKKNDAEAGNFIEQALRADKSDILKHRRLSLLGKVNDRLGNYDAAFRNFDEANGFAAVFGRDREIDPARYAKRIDALIANMEVCGEPAPVSATQNARELVPTFLVGFPRSGTTLLDTILRSHPEIEVLEEQPVISQLLAALPADQAMEPMPVLSAQQRRDLQARYFDLVADKVDRDGASVLVDKFPLNLVEAGFIRAVFPSAKFILVLRHPNDCVLSCFMQTFDLNDAMANFLKLEDAARLYDRSMTLWRLYDDRLKLGAHIIRYEAVVEDLRGAVAPLLDFLGVDWDDNVENYRQTALGRDRINTPSYNQVTQPVYRRAMGRWHHYEAWFAPYAHWLDQWQTHWGYDE